MTITLPLLTIIAGFTLLIISSEFMVITAVSISKKLKINAMYVGLTIIAAGTSTPEIASSFIASLNGLPDIAIGNIIGSNVFNLFFITGIAALFCQQKLHKSLIKIDLPILLLLTLIIIYYFSDQNLTRGEGLSLIFIFIFYLVFLGYRSKNTASEVESDTKVFVKPFWIATILIASIVGLAFGAKLAIHGAVTLGQQFGLSERVLGLTVVSIGTGLPELITSIVAAIRKQGALVFSNILGSNIINTLGIPAAASILHDVPINSRILSFDVLFLIAATSLFLPLALLNKFKISQWQGVALIASYFFFLIIL